jgi:fucokinase
MVNVTAVRSWDYLILTASHAGQAAAYETQLRARLDAGLLPSVRETMVVADLDGRRIGSGGSTLECLRRVVNRERRRGNSPEAILRRLRLLIVHAGGDSRRLPAYSPCGKIFVPIPGPSDGPLPLTLFDRLVPPFLDLPASPEGAGQCVVAAGDALLLFDYRGVRFPDGGLTMLGSPATPEEASRHGVFCAAPDGSVRLYLQKPSRERQRELGAIREDGRAVLDIAVTNLDAAASAALLDAFGVAPSPSGELAWTEDARTQLLSLGIDLYREICCAMGEDATLDHYIRTVRASGSKWSDGALAHLFPALRRIPFRLRVVPECRFLHFGSTRQLVESGVALLTVDRGAPPDSTALLLNNRIGPAGSVEGRDCWVEGCRIDAPLTLEGRAVVIGADIADSLTLADGAALDIVPWREGWFVRCNGIHDSFKDDRFLGRPLEEWLAATGASAADIWDEGDERILWTARLFPSDPDPQGYRRWLWMYSPETASAEDKRRWRETPRASAAAIALAADQDAFHRRRVQLRDHGRKAHPC